MIRKMTNQIGQEAQVIVEEENDNVVVTDEATTTVEDTINETVSEDLEAKGEETISEDGDTKTQVSETEEAPSESVDEESSDTEEGANTDATEETTDDLMTLVEIDGKMVEVPADKEGNPLPMENKKLVTNENGDMVFIDIVKPSVEKSKPETETLKPKTVKHPTRNKPTYDRDPELEHVMKMTCKSMKQLNHVTSTVAKTHNNRHFTLKIESDTIQNLLLHGINKPRRFQKEDLIRALELILNHWNENLGILPDNGFMVCYMRLLLEKQKLETSANKASLLEDEDIRDKVFAHYTNSKYEWTFHSIQAAIDLSDVCEAKTRYINGENKTRIRDGNEWTPFLESMEAYFKVDEDCFADVDVSEYRMKEVGMSLGKLGVRNPRIIGHLVKINAMRKYWMGERAASMDTRKINISRGNPKPKQIETAELDVEDLKSALMSANF